jgi:hypothetical protein
MFSQAKVSGCLVLIVLMPFAQVFSQAVPSQNFFVTGFLRDDASRRTMLMSLKAALNSNRVSVPIQDRLELRRTMRTYLYQNWDRYTQGKLPLGTEIMEYLVLANGAEPLDDGLEHAKENGLFSSGLRVQNPDVVRPLILALLRSPAPPPFLQPALVSLFRDDVKNMHPDWQVRNLARTAWTELAVRNDDLSTLVEQYDMSESPDQKVAILQGLEYYFAHLSFHGLRSSPQQAWDEFRTDIESVLEVSRKAIQFGYESRAGFRILVDGLTTRIGKKNVRKFLRHQDNNTLLKMGELVLSNDRFFKRYLIDSAAHRNFGRWEFMVLMMDLGIPTPEAFAMLRQIMPQKGLNLPNGITVPCELALTE